MFGVFLRCLAVGALVALFLALGGPAASAPGEPRGSGKPAAVTAPVEDPAPPGPATSALDPAQRGGAPHGDPFSAILLELTLLILAAVVGRWGARLLRQPSVLGELLIGVVIGNGLYAMGNHFGVLVMHMDTFQEIFRVVWAENVTPAAAARQLFPAEQLAPGGLGDRLIQVLTGPDEPKLIFMGVALWIFSNLGVILLLFMVGLQSSLDDMLGVGPRAMLVAVVGVVCPTVLGFLAARALLPQQALASDLFLGAALSATSVSITARVFQNLDRLQSREARVVLGAAVIDDVLGLIVLALVVGIVSTGHFQLGQAVKISFLAVAFLGGMVLLSARVIPPLSGAFALLEKENLSLLFPLVMSFTVAWAANLIGLATIVGAFLAGLLAPREPSVPGGPPQPSAVEILKPLEALFAPIFFVLMGMQVNLASFLQPGTLGMAAGLVAAAVVGKLLAGLAAGPGVDPLAVGVGMIPRGEVGLIFASIGKGLGVLSDALFSAVVIMVIVTTLITPLVLTPVLSRRGRAPTP